MTDFTLDPYAARSCPVKTFNEFDPNLALPEVDHALGELFAGGREHRERVLAVVRDAHPGLLDVQEEAPEERLRRTLDMMSGGVPVILAARLSPDPEGHRRGGTDLLVRGDDRPDGGPGYWPVRVKNYRVLEKQTGCQDLDFAPAAHPARRAALPDFRFRTSRQAVLLELAHVWRMLETHGFAAATPLGGIIGTDQLPTRGNQPGVVWVGLDARILRTFSRTAASGFRLRSALERYDHEHGFRVHVAEQAMTRSPDEEPAVRPIRVRECEWCPWWEVCRPRMHDDDLSLRISKTPLDVRELQTLMGLGIQTVTDLAAADVEALLPSYLPLTTHRDHSEQRLRTAARRARMLAAGVELERVTTDPIGIPRADLEVDLDIETAEGDVTYLWGLLVTNRRTGRQEFEHFSLFADIAPADEIDLCARFCRRLLDLVAANPGLRVFHYSDYETVHIRRLAERSGHPDILAATELVADHFVDLFRPVRDNFVGVDGLGLKVVASRGAGFHWRDDAPGGLNSQIWFDSAVHAPSEQERAAARTRVLEYNEDDVRATWAVREWLTDTSGD